MRPHTEPSYQQQRRQKTSSWQTTSGTCSRSELYTLSFQHLPYCPAKSSLPPFSYNFSTFLNSYTSLSYPFKIFMPVKNILFQSIQNCLITSLYFFYASSKFICPCSNFLCQSQNSLSSFISVSYHSIFNFFCQSFDTHAHVVRACV